MSSSSSSPLTELAARVAPSIVGIRGGAGGGSGFVVAPGVAVTLARNVDPDDPPLLATAGDREVPSRLAGKDRTVDLAVLRFDADVDLPALAWVEGAPELPIGTPVFAFGDPGGHGLRATAGAVSSAPRAVRGPAGRLIEGAIEHTAPLPRGSGGGPLLDAQGRVLGLNALRPAQGLLLAWPATALRERAATLAAGGRTAPPRLGVALADARQTRRLRAAVGLPDVDGLLVRGVQDASAAARAGLARGDVLVEVAGRPVDGFDAIYTALDAGRDAATIPLTVLRGADTVTLAIEVGGDAA